MRIPSYDDLTPSIPDISPADVFASAAALLPGSGPVAARVVRSTPSSRQLFAALHGGTVDQLIAIARDFSPRVERHPGGTVVLDIAGLQRLLGEAPAIAADLARAGAPRVAVATSYTAAILLARARSGITVEIGDPEAALREVPIAVLEQFLPDIDAINAIDAVTAVTAAGANGSPRPPTRSTRRSSSSDGRAFDVLQRWGLSTIGEFAALPAGELAARLGAEGVAIQRLARGIDPRPLAPDPTVRRFLESFELEWPIETLEPLSFVFARLLDPLASALERADRGAVALHLDLRLTDRSSHARTLQLPAAMRDPRVLRTLLLLDLESHPPPAAIDVVTIEIDPAPARIVQYSLLERAVPSPETLVTLMARLGALVGDTRCGSPVLLDSNKPDGFAMGPVVFAETRDAGSAGLKACATGESSAGAFDGRVAQAFRPPYFLRRFRPPIAVRVAVEKGRPVRVAIDRRGMPGGAVRQAAGPWRASGGWWEADRWNRDEWDVALDDGTVCRLFCERERARWFLEGVFD